MNAATRQKTVISYKGGLVFWMKPYTISVSKDTGGAGHPIKRFKTLEEAKEFKKSNQYITLIEKPSATQYALEFLNHNGALILGVAIASTALGLAGLGH